MSANITPQLRSLCVPIDTVHLDPGNVRKHPPEQLSKLKGSLTTYGQVTPLTVQESTRVICKGNATWQAAKELGWDVIAVNIVNMDDRTARSYALADNRLSELSEFELEPLGDALRALKDDGVDVVALGWTEAELKPLLDATRTLPKLVPLTVDDSGMTFALKFVDEKAEEIRSVLATWRTTNEDQTTPDVDIILSLLRDVK